MLQHKKKNLDLVFRQCYEILTPVFFIILMKWTYSKVFFFGFRGDSRMWKNLVRVLYETAESEQLVLFQGVLLCFYFSDVYWCCVHVYKIILYISDM